MHYILQGESVVELGTILIAISLVLVLADLLIAPKVVKWSKGSIGYLLSIAGFLALLGAYGLYAYNFLANNFALLEVYTYSSSGLSLLAKFYATWAGARGSMLLLALILGLFYLYSRMRSRREDIRFSRSLSLLMGITLMVFVIILLLRDPFQTTGFLPPDGTGLNPQLQTIWMFVHPPIVLSAYAFVVYIYAYTLACMSTGRRLLWGGGFRISASMAWLLLSIGIALGMVWAYETLGWGGYWSWDPVETASLLPWLALTASFHLSRESGRTKSFSAELMVLITFASLVFLTALTRGGLGASVHAYAVSPVVPVLVAYALGMTGYFFYLKWRSKTPLLWIGVDSSSLESVGRFLSLLSLSMIYLVLLYGILAPIVAGALGFSITLGPSFFSTWTYPFALLFALSLVGCSLTGRLTFRAYFLLIVLALAAGVALALIGWPWANAMASIGITMMTAAIAGVIIGAFYGRGGPVWAKTGRAIVHVGLLLLLVGVLISSTGKEVTTVTINGSSPASALGITLQPGNPSLFLSSSDVYNAAINTTLPERSYIVYEIFVDGSMAGNLEGSLFPNYGFYLQPLVISSLTRDIYVNLDFTTSLGQSLVGAYMGNETVPSSIELTVETVPGINLVWGGAVILCLGIAVSIVVQWRSMSRMSR